MKPFFREVAGCNFVNKGLHCRFFPVNFAKFFRTLFYGKLFGELLYSFLDFSKQLQLFSDYTLTSSCNYSPITFWHLPLCSPSKTIIIRHIKLIKTLHKQSSGLLQKISVLTSYLNNVTRQMPATSLKDSDKCVFFKSERIFSELVAQMQTFWPSLVYFPGIW